MMMMLTVCAAVALMAEKEKDRGMEGGRECSGTKESAVLEHSAVARGRRRPASRAESGQGVTWGHGSSDRLKHTIALTSHRTNSVCVSVNDLLDTDLLLSRINEFPAKVM